jgi:hypothetical protein
MRVVLLSKVRRQLTLVNCPVTQRGLSAATKLEDWVDYAIRSDCAPFSLAQFDNLAQKTRLSRLVVQGMVRVTLLMRLMYWPGLSRSNIHSWMSISQYPVILSCR